MSDRIVSALRRLEEWIDRNGWAGYDPYDVKYGLNLNEC